MFSLGARQMTVARPASKRETREGHVLRDAVTRPGGTRSSDGRAFLSHVALNALLAETTAFLLAAVLPRSKLAGQLGKPAGRLAGGQRREASQAAKFIKA